MLSWRDLVNWSDDKRWVYYDYKNIVDVIDPKYFKVSTKFNFMWSFRQRFSIMLSLILSTEIRMESLGFPRAGG